LPKGGNSDHGFALATPVEAVRLGLASEKEAEDTAKLL
jgi:hypothetical protein